jgi:hypothetical protein
MASGAVKWLISTTVVVGLGTVAWAQEFDVEKFEYDTGCAACHGTDGKGGGPVGPSLTKAPADLTILAKKNNGVFPLSAVYDTIYGIKSIVAHGTRDMPIWGFRYAPSLNPALIPKATDKYSVPTYEPEAVVRTRILAVIDYLNRIQEK